MALTAEDREELAAMMNEAIKANATPPPIPPADPVAVPPVDPAPAPAVTTEQITAAVTAAMAGRSAAEGNQAMEFMYAKALGETSQIEGFTDYLAGEDDASGKPRSEVLEGLDPDKRIAALERMSIRYKAAGAVHKPSGDGATAPLTPAAKMAEDFDQQYKDLDTKWMDGTFKSQAEYAAAQADLTAREINAMLEL